MAAVDEEIAEEALELITVDWEILPAVFDPNEAVQPGAPVLHEDAENNISKTLSMECGSVEKGFAEADLIM